MDKPKKSRKVVKTAETAKMKPRNYMNLFVINDEGGIELVRVPGNLNKSYIQTFGVLTTRTKEEVENWLASHNV